ncbi:MAG: hypothetical protein Q9171_002472 [Xanthocarpia ochracea]
MTKRKRQQGYYTKRMKAVQEGSNEEVLLADIRALLQRSKLEDLVVTDHDSTVTEAPFERFSEVDVKISALSSIGDGLGFSSKSDHVFVVPFTLPGDIAKAKIVTQFADDHYTLTDFLSVLQPSPQRNDALIQCPYFAKCSGCQFQMLSYEDQLAHKRTILEKAYRNFSKLPTELVPVIGDTIGSPLQYAYRTKLTPHFDGPPGSHIRRGKKDGSERPSFDQVPPIGFMVKGTQKTMDIEDCPIATDAVREGLKKERKRVAQEISNYKRGATILLRETTTKAPTQRESSPAVTDSLQPAPKGAHTPLPPTEVPQTNSSPTSTTIKSYLTDQNATSTDHIGPYTFLNPAGAFFQNNNSILSPFTSYIRSHILPPTPSSPPQTPTPRSEKGIKHLIDTYSGSGLFSITLSSLFTSTLGIDISSSSIASARQNAILSNISNATFATGDAANIFAEACRRYESDECVVVIDPPRKGCDDGFLRQLLGFRPRRIVYVSCNVHTQARDVGVLVKGGKEGWLQDGEKEAEQREMVRGGVGDGKQEVQKGGRVDGEFSNGGSSGEDKGRMCYRIESLRGFDFFPQTGHVEGVAILHRVDEE